MDITTSEKDVGVIIDNKLSFDMHIAEKVNKANSVVGAIRRSFEYLVKTLSRNCIHLGKTPLGICQCCMESIQKEGCNYLGECPTESNKNGTIGDWIEINLMKIDSRI